MGRKKFWDRFFMNKSNSVYKFGVGVMELQHSDDEFLFTIDFYPIVQKLFVFIPS